MVIRCKHTSFQECSLFEYPRLLQAAPDQVAGAPKLTAELQQQRAVLPLKACTPEAESIVKYYKQKRCAIRQ